MQQQNSGQLTNPAQPAENKAFIPAPNYSEKEKEYASYLQQRLQLARDARNQNHDEFDGMSYKQYFESNLKGANSFIAPKKNKEDTTFVTGTTRQAILAFLAKINQLNLSPEVKAFDKNDSENVHLGQAMEDIITKADELDHDEEKKLLRQYELFVQGTVFVEEAWTEEFRTIKELGNKKWAGEVKGVEWKERLEKVFEGCRRNIIPGLNVYLGSVVEFDQSQQPYMFVADYIPYDEAKALYGNWERWQYVTPDLQQFSQEQPQTILFNNWRLNNTRKNMVEVIKYQDKWANEFQIILNGVMMMPIGFPLPWKYGEYNIVKQVCEIITPYFAYGGSLVKRLKTAQALENEFWRLAILKTQKSFMPPIANMTGKLISSRVFMPGKITPGLDPSQVKALVPDGQQLGVSNSEVNMMQMLKDNLTQNSLPQISQGQDPQGNDTATQTMALEHEAKILMGLAVFSAAMLEKKLATLRLFDILENWFEPMGEEVDEVRSELREKYRSASVAGHISGKGRGRRLVKLSDDMPTQEEFPGQDDVYSEEEETSKTEGQPVKITYLSPKELKSTTYNWYIEVTAREKESSELSKVLFGNMLSGMEQIGQLAQTTPSANLDFIEERFAEVWNLPADKAFTKQAQAAMAGAPMPMPNAGPGSSQVAQQMQAGVKAPLNTMKPSLNTLNNA